MQPHYLVQTRYLFTTQKLAKESTLSKIKQMIRDYWYVIIPVEVVTSVMWYGGFFLMLKSGVDIVQLLTNIGVSEQTLRFPVSIITFNIQGIIEISWRLYFVTQEIVLWKVNVKHIIKG